MKKGKARAFPVSEKSMPYFFFGAGTTRFSTVVVEGCVLA